MKAAGDVVGSELAVQPEAINVTIAARNGLTCTGASRIGREGVRILLLGAALLGLCTGLRTFTALAVLWLLRHPGPVAWGLAVLAVLEYFADLHPNAPPRTGATGLIARICTGGFCGGALLAGAGRSVVAGVVIGAICAVIGAYAGLAVRMRAIRIVGRVPAALLEDGVAIAASAAVVTWL